MVIYIQKADVTEVFCRRSNPSPPSFFLTRKSLIVYHTYYSYMSKLLTVTISNDVSDTLDRYMRARNVDVPDYMRISKSKFVNGSIKAALESNGVIVVANQIVETPIEILGKDTFIPPTPPPRKSNMPPL